MPTTSNGTPIASVRVYRQGLGDCSFVTLHRAGKPPFRLLIDCGVVVGASGKRWKMQQIANDIVGQLDQNDPRINVLVLTHEHYDHLVGFHLANEVFSRITFEEVWTGWTEDPADPLAVALREAHGAGFSVLEAAYEHLLGLGATAAANELASTLFGTSVEDATGDPDSDESVAGESPFALHRATTTSAFDAAKALGRGEVRYLLPHTIATLPKDVPARVFVLGPPRDADALGRSSPSETNPETYGLSALNATIRATDLWIRDLADDGVGRPFERHLEIPLDLLAGEVDADGAARADFSEPQGKFLRDFGKRLAAQRKFFSRHYFDENETIENSGDGPNQSYRRIDEGSARQFGNLALQLDEHTNNTSLALAVELDDGRVLLFPGDAQVGNCLSWHDEQFESDGGPVSAAELLGRTVFYKVGHHGSHNGTLRERGLEMMHALRYAVVPVSRADAKAVGWTAMPLPELVDALGRRTGSNNGAVLLTDPDEPVAQCVGVTACDLFLEIAL